MRYVQTANAASDRAVRRSEVAMGEARTWMKPRERDRGSVQTGLKGGAEREVDSASEWREWKAWESSGRLPLVACLWPSSPCRCLVFSI
jgi:hypothetical protein